MLRLPAEVLDHIVAHAIAGLPDEACGLLVGLDGEVHRFVPCRNMAASARIYEIDPGDMLRADRAADDDGLAVIGVMHSHTHTEPYPSPTDVAQAPDPTWQFLIVSLKREAPEIRTYLIADGQIIEEAIRVLDR